MEVLLRLPRLRGGGLEALIVQRLLATLFNTSYEEWHVIVPS
jgi:hypothetical protein